MVHVFCTNVYTIGATSFNMTDDPCNFLILKNKISNLIQTIMTIGINHLNNVAKLECKTEILQKWMKLIIQTEHAKF